MIDAAQRKRMKAGLRLTATYKKQVHVVDVVAGEEGKLLYRLADGREFKSPSAAGSAVMGGVACNGWRFWSVDEGEVVKKPAQKAQGAKAKGSKSKAPAKTPGDAKAQRVEVLGMSEEPPID